MSDRYGSISISEEKDSPQENTPITRRPSSAKKKPAGANWAFIWAILAAFVIGSYFLTATYLAPMALQKYLPSYMVKSTGLYFTMGDVKLNPFNFQLTVSDLRADLPGSNAKQALLEIPFLFVDMDLTSLLRNSFVCDKLIIKELFLNITRFKNNHYNLPVLTRIAKEQSQDQIIDFTQLPFLFSFNNIDISNSHILLNDQVTEKTHTVEQLHLAIPTLSNFSFQLEDYILPHFSALINGSFIQLDGKKIALEDGENFQTKLYCSIKGLELSSYLSYLPDDFPLTLTKGVADLNLELGFSPQEKQAERISIDISMTGSDILLHTKKGSNTISLPVVKVDATLTPTNKLLHIKTIVAKKPQLITSQKQLPRGLANFLAIGGPSSKRLGISIDLLLLDDGRLVLTDKKDSVWNALQLSIKDFDRNNNKGSFHVSGEQAMGAGSFSWQGKLAGPGALQGKILLNEFPAETILAQLYTSDEMRVQGSAEFTGTLKLSATSKTTSTYDLDNATLQLHDLQLREKETLWLQADSVRFTRLDKQNTHLSLGNIFLKNASLEITHHEYPPLLSHLFSEKSQGEIKGIDFTGTLAIKPQKENTATLFFSDVKFQANKLEQKNLTENFIFTAKLGEQGVIKSRGQISFSPLQLETNIAFADVDSALFSPYFSEWPLLHYSEAMLHGKGVVTYPTPSFQGNLRFSDGRLQVAKDTNLFSWDSADLSNATCAFNPFSLQSSTLNIQNPQLQYTLQSESPFQLAADTLHTIVATGSQSTDLHPVHIKQITLSNGAASLFDSRSQPTPWEEKISDLHGHLNNFNSKEKGISSFEVHGKLANAPFDLSGSMFLFQEKKNNRARLNLQDFPLHSFAKQLKKNDVQTDTASVSLQAKYLENDSATSSNAELQFNNIQPLSTKSDAALALAILKDSSGTFALTVKRDNNRRSLFQETLDNFQTTVIKASYAPLLLDQEFKDLQDKTFVAFQPGSNTINTAGKELAIRYSELLATHPELGLSITGLADATTDSEILAKAIAPAKPKNITNNDLLTLAKERSLITYDFFIHSLGIPPARISINDSPLVKKESPAHGSKIDIKVVPTDY